jgi:hypothetical protein
MLAWAIGGVVFLLIKQQALIIGAQYSRSLARSAHTSRILVDCCYSGAPLAG